MGGSLLEDQQRNTRGQEYYSCLHPLGKGAETEISSYRRTAYGIGLANTLYKLWTRLHPSWINVGTLPTQHYTSWLLRPQMYHTPTPINYNEPKDAYVFNKDIYAL